jgi:flagellar biosynthesis protein FlhF
MSAPTPKPGRYKFTVKTAEEAVSVIREKLGPLARVVSVRAVEPVGLKKLFRGPRLEVIAEVDAPAESSAPLAGPSLSMISSDDAQPEMRPIDPPTAKTDRNSPTLGLAGLLRRSGLTETVLSRLQAGGNWDELTMLPLHHALAETSRLLRQQLESRPGRPPLSRAAFIGTPGVGRTTALCKWLSVEVFRRARIGHVVTVDFDRPNARGPLPVFAEALGAPLAHFPCGTQPAVPGGFVYFDLPPLCPKGPADNAALAGFLDDEAITERVLVLNAAYDRASLRNSYTAGRDLGATHLVFTHLDEVPHWGKLWDYLFDEALEPLFLSTGPSLTADCEEDVAGAISRRTLADT